MKFTMISTTKSGFRGPTRGYKHMGCKLIFVEGVVGRGGFATMRLVVVALNLANRDDITPSQRTMTSTITMNLYYLFVCTMGEILI
jgi:hypothetical protein